MVFNLNFEIGEKINWLDLYELVDYCHNYINPEDENSEIQFLLTNGKICINIQKGK